MSSSKAFFAKTCLWLGLGWLALSPVAEATTTVAALNLSAPPALGRQASVKPAAIFSTSATKAVSLTVGKATVITLGGSASRVSLSNPGVASAVMISPRQIQLIGNGPGSTSLLVWLSGKGDTYQSYEVTVKRDTAQLEQQLQQVAPGVKVKPLAAKDAVILTGEVASTEEAQLVLNLAQAFFSNNSSNGSNTASATASSAAPAAASSGNSTATSSSAPGSAMTGGTVANVINLLHITGQASSKLEMVRGNLVSLYPGIHLEVVPGSDGKEKAILTGKVPNSAVVAKAINLTSAFYGQAGIKVLSGPGGKGMREVAGTNEFQTATAFSDNMDVNLLQATVLSDTSGNVISLMQVMERPQVRCAIKVLDVSRTASDLLGSPVSSYNNGNIRIQNSFTAPGAPAATGTGIRGLTGATGGIVSSEIEITLQALQQKQLIRSLAEPVLMTLSGEKASFLAGGEVPIPVSDANGRITLEYKEFGIRLNIIPTVTEEGKIHLQVSPEVSAIDPALAFQSQFISIPGIRSRRVQTTVEIQPGQSFLIGGLFSSEDAQSLSRYPFLGEVPIIGPFFRTHYKKKTDSEMVVLIHPEIVSSDGTAWPYEPTPQPAAQRPTQP